MLLSRPLRLAMAVATIVFAFATPKAHAQSADPFCADNGYTQTRALPHNLCDYIVLEKVQFPTIYIGGYYMRTLKPDRRT
jgi:hypothetical protein